MLEKQIMINNNKRKEPLHSFMNQPANDDDANADAG
jgi:hypothetical protein